MVKLRFYNKKRKMSHPPFSHGQYFEEWVLAHCFVSHGVLCLDFSYELHQRLWMKSS